MKYDKTLYGESDLFEMIDASEERTTNGVNISVALESKAVKEEEIKKSAKELEPFSSEELEGYTMPGNDLSRIQIVCGRIAEITVEDEQAVINVEACDGSGSAVIRAKKEDVLDKAKTMQKGDPVTAVIDSEMECVNLRFGPIYGQVCIRLRKKTNKKVGLNCIVSM